MADDPDWFKPRRPPSPPRQPPLGELLYEFYRERDHARWLCELRQHPEPYGVEAQFYRNEEFDHSRRFDQTMSRERTPREMAIAWAEKWRKELERDDAGNRPIGQSSPRWPRNETERLRSLSNSRIATERWRCRRRHRTTTAITPRELHLHVPYDGRRRARCAQIAARIVEHQPPRYSVTTSSCLLVFASYDCMAQ